MHTLFPNLYRIKTLSTSESSPIANRNFSVPSSFETCRSIILTAVSGYSSDSFCAIAFGILVISL